MLSVVLSIVLQVACFPVFQLLKYYGFVPNEKPPLPIRISAMAVLFSSRLMNDFTKRNKRRNSNDKQRTQNRRSQRCLLKALFQKFPGNKAENKSSTSAIPIFCTINLFQTIHRSTSQEEQKSTYPMLHETIQPKQGSSHKPQIHKDNAILLLRYCTRLGSSNLLNMIALCIA